MFSQLNGDYNNIWKDTQNLNKESLTRHLKKLDLKSDQLRDFCTLQQIKVGKVQKPLMIDKLVANHLKQRPN